MFYRPALRRTLNQRKPIGFRRRLALESMERRLTMAADISFDAQTGVLAIEGDAREDYAFVHFAGTSVDVTLVSQQVDGTWLQLNFNRPINGVRRIEFAAGNGDNLMEVTQGTLARGVSLLNTEVLYLGGNHVDEFTNNTGIRSAAYGGFGNDTLRGGSGVDELYGGGDRDEIFGNLGADTIDGGAGNDFLFGGGGNDLIYGGDGVNRLNGEAGNDTLIGGDEVDFMTGGAGNDVLEGRRGNDILDGGHGDDHLYGGDDHDTLLGGHGYDRLFGASGNDTLNGGYDDSIDYLEGGLGEDVFQSIHRRWLAGNWAVLQIDTVGDQTADDLLQHQTV